MRCIPGFRTMSAMAQSFYITTPIYYVNDRPHIGHCYTTMVADVLARFERLARGGGSDVFFLTGTDEHADKVVTSAKANGFAPQEWADRNAEEFRRAFAFMGCSHDDFIRTTEERHKSKVPGYIRRLLDSGDIYKGEYTGWYDEGQEEYVTETAAREAGYKSTISGRALVKRTEVCYFFRLGRYQQPLLEHIQANPGFLRPEARRQEVLGRLRPPAVLHDVPVSRPVTDDPATQWGIRVPGDPSHRIYVWIDALFNYLTVVDTPERRRFWPATVHLIGKDILWFHAVIWPALLMALGEDLPRTVYGHGWWVAEGQKMSKSLGNFIDLGRLKAYAERYSLDALRWYLATQGPMSGTDADFSHAKFVEVYNADLANGVGNCVSRVGNMVEKYFGGALPERGDDGTRTDWPALAERTVARAQAALGEYDAAGALRAGADLVREVDQYINITAPFRLARSAGEDASTRARLGAILYNCAEALRIATILFSPAMPVKMGRVWEAWGCAPPVGTRLAEACVFGGACALRPGQHIGKGEALFQRADPGERAPAGATG
jgi:methionyl-tRNA synthetase